MTEEGEHARGGWRWRRVHAAVPQMWAWADSAVSSPEPVGMAPAGTRPLPFPVCGMSVSVPALQPPRALGRYTVAEGWSR
jgi:hypothetical protein